MEGVEGDTASRYDVHLFMYIFQGTDARVENSFAPLGPPLLPWQNRMGMGHKYTVKN